MEPLYEDMTLDAAKLERVWAWIEKVDFHLPGATAHDFRVGDTAKYLGFMFLSEDLESYAVPLTCTRGEHSGYRTFIRMSRDQLLGKPDAKKLPVNKPVTGADVITTNRWRPTDPDTTRTGVDAYEFDAGDVPGFEMDMAMLERTFHEVLEHDAAGLGKDPNTYGDISVNWGTLMAGRYPRLLHYRNIGKLTPKQADRLEGFEKLTATYADVFKNLGLADPQMIRH